MPTVPYDVPTVDMQAGSMPAFSGQAVQPRENYGAKQQMELGKSMMSAGEKITHAGQQIQDELDDAATKKADTWFLSEAQKLLLDKDSGYLHTQSEQAQARYGTTLEGLNQLRKDAEGLLTTDTQRKMFGRVVDRHMLTFTGQMSNHAVQQVRTFAAKESEARETQYINAAVANFSSRDAVSFDVTNEDGTVTTRKTGAFNTYLKTAVDEANQRASMLGLPEKSSQRESMVMAATGKIHAGVVTQLVLSNKYVEARKWLDRAIEDGEIDTKSAQTLGTQIEVGYRKEVGTNAGEAIYKNRGPAGDDFDSSVDWVMTQEGGYVANDGGKGETKYGINATANPGVDIKNLTPEKAKKIYRKQYWDAIDADNLAPELRAVAFDTAVNMGVGTAKRLIKESGGDPQALIDLRRQEYMALVEKNPEKYAKYEKGWIARLDKLEANLAGGERTLASMIAEADQIADPEERAIAKATIKGRHSEYEAVQSADYKDNLVKATDIAFKRPSGWQDIPAPMWAKIKQSDRARLMEMPRGDDPDVVMKLHKNPQLWKTGSIEQYRPLLSESTYQKFFMAGNGADGQGKIVEASVDVRQFNNALNEAGLSKLVEGKKGSSDQKQYNDLYSKFEQMLEVEQSAKGRKFSIEEKNRLLQMLIKPVKVKAVYESYDPRGWFGDGKTTMDVRSYQVQNPQNIVIPPDARKRIEADFAARGITRFTEQNILNAYLMMSESK